MQIASRYLKNTKVLTLKGCLDYHAKSEFDLAIEFAKEIRCQHIILDFTQVSGVDSAGLGRIVLCTKKLHNQGIQLTLLNPTPQIREFLQQLETTLNLPICDTEEQALAMCG